MFSSHWTIWVDWVTTGRSFAKRLKLCWTKNGYILIFIFLLGALGTKKIVELCIEMCFVENYNKIDKSLLLYIRQKATLWWGGVLKVVVGPRAVSIRLISHTKTLWACTERIVWRKSGKLLFHTKTRQHEAACVEWNGMSIRAADNEARTQST